jgi:hypothetical protein
MKKRSLHICTLKYQKPIPRVFLEDVDLSLSVESLFVSLAIKGIGQASVCLLIIMVQVIDVKEDLNCNSFNIAESISVILVTAATPPLLVPSKQCLSTR